LRRRWRENDHLLLAVIGKQLTGRDSLTIFP
jgi:hypothetical protein